MTQLVLITICRSRSKLLIAPFIYYVQRRKAVDPKDENAREPIDSLEIFEVRL
jgi:hypothetical protein